MVILQCVLAKIGHLEGPKGCLCPFLAQKNRILRCFLKMVKYECAFYSVFGPLLGPKGPKHSAFWITHAKNIEFYCHVWPSRAILGHFGLRKGLFVGQIGQFWVKKDRKLRCFLSMRVILQCVLAQTGHFTLCFWPQNQKTP